MKKLVEVVKGWILAGWAQKSPQPCSPPSYAALSPPVRACLATPCPQPGRASCPWWPTAVDGPGAHPWPIMSMRLGPWSAPVTGSKEGRYVNHLWRGKVFTKPRPVLNPKGKWQVLLLGGGGWDFDKSQIVSPRFCAPNMEVEKHDHYSITGVEVRSRKENCAYYVYKQIVESTSLNLDTNSTFQFWNLYHRKFWL
jgi:hypothetical protein